MGDGMVCARRPGVVTDAGPVGGHRPGDSCGGLHGLPFPKNRGELDAMYDRLDTEGLFAAGKALNRLYDAVQPLLPTLDEAKNSTGTPISELPVG